MASASVRSDVWKFFCKTAEKKLSCKLCNKEFAYHGGTSNLRDHLQRSHTNKYNTTLEKQQTLPVMLVPEVKVKVIDELLMNVVSVEIRPLSFVEGEGMCCLLNYLEPGYRLPSRTLLTVLQKLQKTLTLTRQR